MAVVDDGPEPRQRILDATAVLLRTDGRGGVTTRAVSAAAGVQPQTIYRQFGDMAGLLDEVATHGFQTYLASKSQRRRRSDPVDDLRDGWDLHIDFGLHNPALYLLMYGQPDTSHESAAALRTRRILRELVEAVARVGRLRVDVDTAAAMIHSTGIGVVMTLIGDDAPTVADALSTHVREAVLAAITTTQPAAGPTSPTETAAAHAIALRAVVPDSGVRLTPGEAQLLDELLARISTRDTSPNASGS